MVGCARPTCGAVAEVGLGYDAVGRVAWLATLDDSRVALVPLCTRHAEQVTLPTGWIGRDDRGTQSTLWLPAAEHRTVTATAEVVPLPVSPPGTRRRVLDDGDVIEELPVSPPGTRRRVLDDGDVIEELPLWTDERHDPAAHLAGDLYGDRRPPNRSAPAPAADEPHSPLLARAFRAAGLG